MKYINYIYALILVTGLALTACDKADGPAMGDDMLQIEGITLGLGSLDEASAQATTRANVGGVDYAVNTASDPTWTKNAQNRIIDRDDWKLDLDLFNGNVEVKYGPGSFTGMTSPDGLNWKPTGDLVFPNYYRPWASAWLYHTTKDATVATDQSDATKLLAQDQLYRPKSRLDPIAKRITLQMEHQRAMLNFKFEDVVRSDIDTTTVKVWVGTTDYIPYKVRESGILEYMLILPETTPKSTEILVTYSTNATTTHQAINYKQKVKLNSSSGNLGSNNAYCFTLSGKELEISPVTVVNWVTGEPVAGQYVAVTAYPTFKGPANTTYYFYYDNKLTEDGTLNGTPKLQKIDFNRDGECTIKPDGRILTHIFPAAEGGGALTFEDEPPYKLGTPVILGGSAEGKMYINLTDIIVGITAP